MTLRPGLPDGTYSATYRVVSADSHVVSGSVTFGIGVGPSGAVAAPVDNTGALRVAVTAARALVYLGLVLLVGTALACATLWRWAFEGRRLHRLAAAGTVLVAVGTAVELLVQGPLARNEDWSTALWLDGLTQTATSGDGMILLVRLALLLVAAVLLTERWWGRLTSGVPALIAAATGLGLVLSVVLTGHESTGSQVALAMPVATLHVLAMAFWLGGLLSLLAIVLPAAAAGELGDPPGGLGDWSRLAFGCVAVLVVTGEYQAYRQVSPVQSLWTTSYGGWLLVKIGVIAFMLLAALAGHRVVAAMAADRTSVPASVPSSSGGPSGSAGPGRRPAPDELRAVRRSVAIEMALAIGVLVITSILVAQPPAGRPTVRQSR